MTTPKAKLAGLALIAALLLLTLAAPASGQDFEKGMQAYQRGEQAHR